MGFFEYISQHWYVGVALVLLVVLTVFVWFKAAIAGRKRAEERARIIAEIEKEKALRKEFRTVDKYTFSDDKDDYRLIVGMCAHIQQNLENEEDMNLAFETLSEVEQNIYALGYVFEDSKKGLSEFFRANGEPLLSVSDRAVKNVIDGESYQLFHSEFMMLDENDETTSVDNSKLEDYDEKFKKLLDENSRELYGSVASYIRKNKDIFIA